MIGNSTLVIREREQLLLTAQDFYPRVHRMHALGQWTGNNDPLSGEFGSQSVEVGVHLDLCEVDERVKEHVADLMLLCQ